MPYFMMSNRKIVHNEPGEALANEMAYYVAEDADAKKLTQFSVWQKVPAADFRKRLTDIASEFPILPDDDNEKQKHISLFIHGYNTGWREAAIRYADLCKRLYSGQKGIGTLVLYTWPSDGSVAGYLPDREDARDSAPALAGAFVLY